MKKDKALLRNLTLIVAAAVLFSACGTLEIGVETPPMDHQENDMEDEVVLDEELSADDQSADGPRQEPHRIQAWFGHVASAPEGTGFDDRFVLLPEGTGAVGLAGGTEAIDAELASLRDATGPEEHVHIWGQLTCGVDDVGGCRVIVDQLRYGSIMVDPDIISGWEGVITTSSFNGGLSYVFVREEDGFSILYSIHSTDSAILDQLSAIAGTDQRVRVDGTLMSGIPDVNGTRIQAESLEVVGVAEAVPGTTPEAIDLYSGWETYTSERYGYSFRYPVNATITESGVMGFDPETLPEGMTIETYMGQLMEAYGEDLCVHVENGLGYITITAPENADFRYTPCGRTGMGTGERVDRSMEVEVAGQTIQAVGYEMQGESETLDSHNETFILALDNGLRIEFGSVLRPDATYADYRMKGIDGLLLILASLTILP